MKQKNFEFSKTKKIAAIKKKSLFDQKYTVFVLVYNRMIEIQLEMDDVKI